MQSSKKEDSDVVQNELARSHVEVVTEDIEDDTSDISPGDDDVEEELVDQQVVLKNTCGSTKACASLYEELQVCNDRVSNRVRTKETCQQELYDFISCVDQCVTKTLFKFLK